MHALITNDDGVDAEGIRVLALAALEAGLRPVVAAPVKDQSGIGAGLRAVEDHGRILIERRTLDGLAGVPVFAVAATPAYIALLGVRGAFGPEPGLVLSGVNHGANTGRSVIHSGTAGAALTAASDGYRALAVSIDLGPRDDAIPHWDTVSGVIGHLIPVVLGGPPAVMLNVNVPNLPAGEVRGVRRAELAAFGAVQMNLLERGEGYVRMSLEESGAALDPDSDDGLLARGYVTVTALRPLADATDVGLDDLPDLVGGRLP